MKKGYPSTTLHATLTFTSQHVDSTQGHGSKWKAVPHFVYCRCALVVHPSPAPVLHTVQCGNSMKCSIRKTFSPLPSAVGELNVTPERLRAARDSSHRRTDGRTHRRVQVECSNTAVGERKVHEGKSTPFRMERGLGTRYWLTSYYSALLAVGFIWKTRHSSAATVEWGARAGGSVMNEGFS